MRVFKDKAFNRWAKSEKLSDEALRAAIKEMNEGLLDANLGGNVYKKRVAIPGRGKSGGARTLIAFKLEDKVFYMYGFAKNERANISTDELKALKLYAKQLLAYSDIALDKAVKANVLFEVEDDE